MDREPQHQAGRRRRRLLGGVCAATVAVALMVAGLATSDEPSTNVLAGGEVPAGTEPVGAEEGGGGSTTSSVTSPSSTSTSISTSTSTSTSTPTGLSTPTSIPKPKLTPPSTATPRSTDAPRFVGAVLNTGAGTIDVTFDVPVRPDHRWRDPGSNLRVYGQQACDELRIPAGSGGEFVAGVGTPTVTLEISGLVPGTVSLQVMEGMVESVAGGVPNEEGPCLGLPGLPAAPPTKWWGAVVTAGTRFDSVSMNWDQKVELGDPARLLVYGADSTCTNLAGRGTNLQRSGHEDIGVVAYGGGFVPGTTYIRIEPGFVTGRVGGLPNAETPCTGVRSWDALWPSS